MQLSCMTSVMSFCHFFKGNLYWESCGVFEAFVIFFCFLARKVIQPDALLIWTRVWKRMQSSCVLIVEEEQKWAAPKHLFVLSIFTGYMYRKIEDYTNRVYNPLRESPLFTIMTNPKDRRFKTRKQQHHVGFGPPEYRRFFLNNRLMNWHLYPCR